MKGFSPISSLAARLGTSPMSSLTGQHIGSFGSFGPIGSYGMQNQLGGNQPGLMDPNANVLGGTNMGQQFPAMQQEGLAGQFNPATAGGMQNMFGAGGVGQLDPNANVLGGTNMATLNSGSAMGATLPAGMNFKSQPLAGNVFANTLPGGLETMGAARQFDPNQQFAGALQNQLGGSQRGMLDPSANVLGGMNIGHLGSLYGLGQRTPYGF